MINEVKIPAVGESITSGVVSVWHKKSGEFVKSGDVLFTLETDKVSTEISAESNGLLQTRVDEGAEVKIGEVVATIDDSKSPPVAGGGDSAQVTAEKASKSAAKTPGSAPPATDARSASELSPAVRRLVEEQHLEPEKISGTGKGGRLTKADVLEVAQNKTSTVGDAVSVPGKQTAGTEMAGKQTASPTGAPSKPAAKEIQDGADRFTRRKMSPLRRKIAAQLVMAQHTAAILTTFNECDMTAVMELRTKSQDAFSKKNGVKLGFMSFFIKATVEALKAGPCTERTD